jgi:hypothetical protein
MTSCGEALRVSLHNINCWTLRLACAVIFTPIALLVIQGYEEDTGSAITTHITHIDIKLQGAAQVLVLESLINLTCLFFIPLITWPLDRSHIAVGVVF